MGVYFNQKLVCPPNDAYPYRANIETLLNYNDTAIPSHLANMFYYPDIPERMNGALDSGDSVCNIALCVIFYRKSKNRIFGKAFTL